MRKPLIAVAGVLLLAGGFLFRRPAGSYRDFDGQAVGALDAAMWRSYYERRPVRLFVQLAQTMRTEFRVSWARALPMAYRAARAALVFKDGHGRADYAKALPDLERYFAAIDRATGAGLDATAAARDELEWWIIRREPAQHTTADWERLVAAVAANMYRVPAERVQAYAQKRVEAMVLRDAKGAAMTAADWAAVEALLREAWSRLATVVRGA